MTEILKRLHPRLLLILKLFQFLAKHKCYPARYKNNAAGISVIEEKL